RMRTFSKAYGMAGARVGYALGAASLIAEFEKVRNHFGLTRTAQAGARAAVKDTEGLAHVCGEVAAARATISRVGGANGHTALPSGTNFVAVDCGKDGDFARALLAALTARGIFVRMPSVAPLDRCIRVSCGSAGDLERFAAALPDALAEARS